MPKLAYHFHLGAHHTELNCIIKALPFGCCTKAVTLSKKARVTMSTLLPENTLCPCGSNDSFNQCCEPILDGVRKASSAEALMRSRYTAFAVGNVDYLIKTTAKEKRAKDDRKVLNQQVKSTTWLGLTIEATSAGSPLDQTGTVTFRASFQSGPEKGVLHECSRFRKDPEGWVYVDGEVQFMSV
jgi:SEC-C motif-containing protein